MNKEAIKDPVPPIDGDVMETSVDRESESEAEGGQFLNLDRERVGLINVRHNPKKGNKSGRY